VAVSVTLPALQFHNHQQQVRAKGVAAAEVISSQRRNDRPELAGLTGCGRHIE
jgi:hypothetical protein